MARGRLRRPPSRDASTILRWADKDQLASQRLTALIVHADDTASNSGTRPLQRTWATVSSTADDHRYSAGLMVVQSEFSTSPGPAPRPQTKAQAAAAGAAAEIEAMQELVQSASAKLARTQGTVTQHGFRGTNPEQNAMNLNETLQAMGELLDGMRDHLGELGSLLQELAEG